MKQEHVSFRETFRSLLPLKIYFLENRRALAAGLFSLLAVDFLQLTIPLIIKRAVDALTVQKAEHGLLLQYGLTIVLIATVMALFRYVWRYFLFGHARKVERGVRDRLYGHLQRLSPAFFQRTKTGDLMARAINDLNAVRMATGIGLVALIDGLVLGLAAVGFMLYISRQLTLIALLFAPLTVYFARVLTRRMATAYERVQKRFSDLTERVREGFAGIRVVKAYTREAWSFEKVAEEGRLYVSENMRLARTVSFFSPLMTVFSSLGLALVIWIGGRFTILGRITPGEFVAFISYLGLLAWPMFAMGWVTNLMQRGAASMRRINRVLEEEPEIEDRLAVHDGFRIAGDIRFKGLGFRFPGQSAPALAAVDLHIEKGRTVALVGRVGAGKTALLQTIPRLLKVAPGTLFIDERDVLTIPLEILRSQIGFVTQEAVVFSDTVRNNVSFGREGMAEETLWAALEAAQLHEDIRSHEGGLEMVLGEKGVRFSGGQRQRLTLARALVTDPPILILDDALSMVDTRTEERILNRLLEMRRGRTNLIVSHRVSTIRRADLVLVLDRGRLVESGDHASLLALGGIYARLYERQLLAEDLEIGPVWDPARGPAPAEDG